MVKEVGPMTTQEGLKYLEDHKGPFPHYNWYILNLCIGIQSNPWIMIYHVKLMYPLMIFRFTIISPTT